MQEAHMTSFEGFFEKLNLTEFSIVNWRHFWANGE